MSAQLHVTQLGSMTKLLHFSFEPTFSYVMLVTDLELKAQRLKCSFCPHTASSCFSSSLAQHLSTHILSGQRDLSIFLPSRGTSIGWAGTTGAGVT